MASGLVAAIQPYGLLPGASTMAAFKKEVSIYKNAKGSVSSRLISTTGKPGKENGTV